MATKQVSDLFELKNFFVLGNYQLAVNEGFSVSGSLKEQDKIGNGKNL
jgi:hypothetical protein